MGITEEINYYFNDNKAYTEDDVLVYNIFVYKVPKKVTHAEFYMYFKQFGEVNSFLLDPNKGEGSVNYSNPISAARALQRPNHTFQLQRVSVKACDTWEQPDILNGNNVSKNALDFDEDTFAYRTSPSLLHLNDYCLERVCKQLKLREQVRFGLVCQRMHEIFCRCCAGEHKLFNLKNLMGMTLWEIREFLKVAGSQMETLTGTLPHKDCERVVEFLGRYCQNVKSVYLNSLTPETNCLQKLCDHMPEITTLELSDCSLKDNDVMSLRMLPRLEELILSSNEWITGKHLDRVRHLKKLNLYGCSGIQTSCFVDMCKALKDLESLDIQRCERLSSTAFSKLASNCKKLEELSICSSADVQYESVANLPKLKRLEVYCFGAIPVRDQLFVALARAKNCPLEYLKVIANNWMTTERAELISQLRQLKKLLCGSNINLDDGCLRRISNLPNLEELQIEGCPAITDEGLLLLLRKCPKLKRIEFTGCTNITDRFVLDAIDVLWQRQAQLDEPVVFAAAGTSISDLVEYHPAYMAAQLIIKVKF